MCRETREGCQCRGRVWSCRIERAGKVPRVRGEGAEQVCGHGPGAGLRAVREGAGCIAACMVGTCAWWERPGLAALAGLAGAGAGVENGMRGFVLAFDVGTGDWRVAGQQCFTTQIHGRYYTLFNCLHSQAAWL